MLVVHDRIYHAFPSSPLRPQRGSWCRNAGLKVALLHQPHTVTGVCAKQGIDWLQTQSPGLCNFWSGPLQHLHFGLGELLQQARVHVLAALRQLRQEPGVPLDVRQADARSRIGNQDAVQQVAALGRHAHVLRQRVVRVQDALRRGRAMSG